MTAKQTLHIDPYEKTWIFITAGLLVVFAVAVFVAGFAMGIQVPAPQQRVNPQLVATEWADRTTEPRKIAEGKYEVYIIARAWSFIPNEIHIPAGSEVTFYITAIDYQHGFLLEGTNLNVQVIPGHVSSLTITLDTPGVYNYICTEYCGTAHMAMAGKLFVEEP
jgi:cytochrome c oxidase subunit 2